MSIDLVFKIAAIGIIVAILDMVLHRSNRDDIAMITSLAGLVIVLFMIVEQISRLFSTIKSTFGL
ncbi:MAG TPA: stage III sporulation protein AC [Ruminiclostridium sp.]|jgi:stage III sporulation protein AC|nr:stage III sporulation protein AC [Ruminiclostridium sp.]